MAEELLINVNPFETRVALVVHGLLQEVHLARRGGYSVTGNIYLGRVERIGPGMQAAFVDIGLERTAFLHASDIANGGADSETEACRKAVSSRPMSTKAACMPGNTRSTRPL